MVTSRTRWGGGTPGRLSSRMGVAFGSESGLKSRDPMGKYVDLHSHYLPALDDGSKSQAMSLQMVRAVAALGFTELHATPHQRANMFMPERAQIDAAFRAVSDEVAAVASGLRLG